LNRPFALGLRLEVIAVSRQSYHSPSVPAEKPPTEKASGVAAGRLHPTKEQGKSLRRLDAWQGRRGLAFHQSLQELPESSGAAR
jgi:hypothetical protein